MENIKIRKLSEKDEIPYDVLYIFGVLNSANI